jgi:hypothetical protein
MNGWMGIMTAAGGGGNVPELMHFEGQANE